MIEIAWGIRSEDGRVVGVDQVESGLACGCVCPECHKPLVAAKGDIVVHHFRHHSEQFSACGGGQETALHRLAKTMVAEAAAITIPDGTTDIVSAELEVWLDGIRPDVLLHTSAGDLAVEIVVSHWTKKEKIATFAERKLDAMEIDISPYRGVVMSAEELQGVVLTYARRQWLKVKPIVVTVSHTWIPQTSAPRLSFLSHGKESFAGYSYPSDTVDDAWSRGFQARESGESKDNNPYRSGFARHLEWFRGWDSAVHITQL